MVYLIENSTVQNMLETNHIAADILLTLLSLPFSHLFFFLTGIMQVSMSTAEVLSFCCLIHCPGKLSLLQHIHS